MTEQKKPERDKTTGQFIQGLSGNPSGRPKGSRNKLGEAFIQALYESFEKHGPQTIETVRVERPHEYLKVCASLLPKELVISKDDNLSDDELNERIRQLASVVRLDFGEAGTSRAAGGEAAPDTAH